MNREKFPYITECGFCENGLLRFMRCVQCEAVSAVCDECELIWSDVEAVSADPSCPSSSAYPACPVCGARDAAWTKLEQQEAEEANLGPFIAGESV
jgi:hypothetical protein